MCFLKQFFSMEGSGGSSCPRNKSQTQNSRKKKAPRIEWEYAINIGDQFMDWECKLCQRVKSHGAPQLRDHFLGGSKKTLCTHPSAPMVANCLREENFKKRN